MRTATRIAPECLLLRALPQNFPTHIRQRSTLQVPVGKEAVQKHSRTLRSDASLGEVDVPHIRVRVGKQHCNDARRAIASRVVAQVQVRYKRQEYSCTRKSCVSYTGIEIRFSDVQPGVYNVFKYL